MAYTALFQGHPVRFTEPAKGSSSCALMFDDVERVLEAIGVDQFELVIELVVEVAGFEDELLVEDVLVDAEVVGARALRGDGRYVVRGDGGLIARFGEAQVEASEGVGEGWLL